MTYTRAIKILFVMVLSVVFILPSKSVLAATPLSAQDKAKLITPTSSSTPLTTIKKTTIVKKPVDKAALKLAKIKKYRFVKRGEVIGHEGGQPNTCGCGQSIGPHLHFEVRVAKASINPKDKIGKAMSWPLIGYRVTQEFGPADWTPWYTFHSGIDLAANSGLGTPVRAAAAGRIIFDGITNGYGHLIIIDHGKGILSYYGHLKC